METDKSEFPPDGSVEQLGVSGDSRVETVLGKEEKTSPGTESGPPAGSAVFTVLC